MCITTFEQGGENACGGWWFAFMVSVSFVSFNAVGVVEEEEGGRHAIGVMAMGVVGRMGIRSVSCAFLSGAMQVGDAVEEGESEGADGRRRGRRFVDEGSSKEKLARGEITVGRSA